MKILQSKYGLTDEQMRLVMGNVRRRGLAYTPSEVN